MRSTQKIHKKNFIHLLAAALTAVTLMLAGIPQLGPAMAAESGSLTVTLGVTNETTHKVTLISGASITVFQIASLDQATRTYTLDPAYAAQETAYRTAAKKTKGNIFDGMTASQSNTLAGLIARSSVKNGAQTQVTNAQGQASFTGLKEGMYLVAETATSGMAAKYTTIDPYLISVPLFEDGKWISAVSSNPKTAVKPIPETTPETTPQTTPETTPQTTPETTPQTTPETKKQTEETEEFESETEDNGKKGEHRNRSGGGGSVTGGGSSQVKTGDTSKVETWTGVLLMSAAVIAGLLAGKRRKEEA